MLRSRALCFMTFVNVALTLDCGPGWFGPECQYKSHCLYSDCDLDGNCPRDARCERAWFGPACQYVDLAASPQALTTHPATSWTMLTDRDDQTCSLVTNLTVAWDTPHLITWIRLYLPPSDDTDLTATPQIVITDVRKINHQLSCRRIFGGQLWTLDIHCDLKGSAKMLQIWVQPGRHLCSIYISGGRNVALKQASWQSTAQHYDKVDLESGLAVDGGTRTNTKSCTATKHGDQDPTWELRLTSPKLVYQFVIYNRIAAEYRHRLRGFTLTGLGVGGKVAFTLMDMENSTQDVYIISLESPALPVHLIRIQASPQLNTNNKSELILALCEVEVYGDTDCNPGTFGLDCEQACCNCVLKDEMCFYSTGGCPSGCVSDLYNGSCLGDSALSSGPALFVGIGVAVTVVSIIIVTVLVWFCRKKLRSKGKQEYDMPGPVEQYSHEYNVLRPVPGNLEMTSPDTRATSAIQESGLYERIDSHHYAELQDSLSM